jgi:derlin-1
MQAQYLPAVQIAYEFLMSYGSTPMVSIIGCASGYLYNYFTNEYPRAAGVRLLDTPNWLKSLFPPTARNTGGFGNAAGDASNVRLQAGRPEQPSNSMFGGHQWGPGNRLG